MEEAAAQERVRQFLFVVRGDDHDRALDRLHRLAGFVDVEFHPIELLQEVVGEFDVGLVDLVDQQHGQLGRGERLPQFAAADVVGDVVDPLVAELAVAEAGNSVIFVEALDGAGGRLDVPFDQRRAQRRGDLVREDGLAGAGFALDQQGPAELDRGVDRDLEVVGRDIIGGAFETHGPALWARRAAVQALAEVARAAARASSRSNRPRFWSSSCSPPKPSARSLGIPSVPSSITADDRVIVGQDHRRLRPRCGPQRDRARRALPRQSAIERGRSAKRAAAPLGLGKRLDGVALADQARPRSRPSRASRAGARPPRSAGRDRAVRARMHPMLHAASPAPARRGSRARFR